MSFKDFKKDLLIAIAIVSKTQPTFDDEALNIANARKLTFREGWLRQAVESLDGQGLIRTSYFLGGGENLGMSVSITGAGIEEAENIANESGYDLYEEIEEQGSEEEEVNIAERDILARYAPASDRIVKIDHNSEQYRNIIDGIDEVVRNTKASNSLRIDFPNEIEQRIAELEAGKSLLQARQANTDLVGQLIIPALRWVGEKIADNLAATLISGLIALLVAWLGL